MNELTLFTILFLTLFMQAIFWKLKKVWDLQKKRKIYSTLARTNTKKAESELEKTLAKLNSRVQKTHVGKRFEMMTSRYMLPTGFTLTNLLLITAGVIWIAVSLASLIEVSVVLLVSGVLIIEAISMIFLTSRRGITKEFDKGYPQLLESLANMYKVQPDLKLAIHRSSQAVENSITRSFLIQIDKLTKVGIQVTEAFDLASKKLQYQPLEMFLSAVRLHQQHGGDLSKLFTQTSIATRKRQESEKLVKSTLFQNKVSSVTISVLVPILFVIAVVVSSNYRTVVFTDPLARTLTVFSFIWWAIGVFVMSRVMRAKF